MDVERLKNKRQLNVQEQNLITEARILSEATYWRKKGCPIALDNFLCDKSINTESMIFVEYDQDSLDCSTDRGIILTEDKRFIKFEMDLSKKRTQ